MLLVPSTHTAASMYDCCSATAIDNAATARVCLGMRMRGRGSTAAKGVARSSEAVALPCADLALSACVTSLAYQ